MLDLLAEYMEKGFLENIVDALRHDPALFAHLPALMADQRSRVRIGTVALVETLGRSHEAEIRAQLPGLLALLAHENTAVRGDALYLLEIIGDPAASAAVAQAVLDPHPAVAALARETLESLKNSE
jgi:HEAT repeat protein